MSPERTNFVFIALCCLISVQVVLCTSSGASPSSVEITARVTLTAFDIAAANVTNSTETITWMTNGLTNSTVEYGPNAGYGQSATDPAMVTSHAITLNGLAAGQQYHYRVVSSDSAGTTCISPDFTFTTQDGESFTGSPETSAALTVVSGGLIPLTANNLVSQPVAIVSADRSASLTLDASTKILDNKGRPLSRIGLTRIAGKDVPIVGERSGFVFTGYAYQVNPSGATFSRLPALKIAPTSGDWRQISGKDISIQYYNPASGHWEVLSTTTNQTTRTATALISHTSVFGLFSRQTTLAPPVTVTTAVPTTRPNQKPWESILSIDIVQKGLELLKNYLKSSF